MRTTEDADGIARYSGYTDGSSGDQATDYAYNKAGVLTRSTYPDDTSGGGGDRGYVEHFYDAALRLTKVTDQEAQDTVIVYDSMSRRSAITKGTEVDTFTYMPWGAVSLARRGTTSGGGNADATSQSERLYDGLLRLTREAQSVKETAARNVDYAYDAANNMLTLTYPNGAAIATSYTENNQRNVISRGGSQLADYDYVGYRPKSLTYETGANDVVLTHSYDGGARLTRMAYAQSGNATLPDFSYSFDAASNITRKKFEHRSGTPSEDYLYDTLDRLTRTDFGQRTSTPYESFVYDDLGNHLTQNDNGTEIAGLFNAVNEQTKRDGVDVLYDKNGNLTKDDTVQVYFYDRQNLLTRVEDGSSNRIASYAYDAFNRRIEKDVENGATDTITRFYYTADWRLLEETDDAGTPAVQRYYVWGNYIDELLMFRDVAGVGGTANADYFACRHHNYNIVTLLNSTGAVVERYDYNPYGKRIVLNPDYTEDASGGDGLSDFGLAIGHQGLMHDDESGLVYNLARMLHTGLARFIQRDPLDYIESGGGYHDGMNLYQYLVSNPLVRVDPSGMNYYVPPPLPPIRILLPPETVKGMIRFAIAELNEEDLINLGRDFSQGQGQLPTDHCAEFEFAGDCRDCCQKMSDLGHDACRAFITEWMRRFRARHGGPQVPVERFIWQHPLVEAAYDKCIGRNSDLYGDCLDSCDNECEEDFNWPDIPEVPPANSPPFV